MSNGAPRSLHRDLSRLEEALAAAAGELDDKLRDAVDDHPLLAVGAAASIGFLLGGGLRRGSVTLLLGVGARLAGSWLEREFLERADAQENAT